MKPHTSDFKNAIKVMGRELNGVITYGNTILDEEIMSITPHYEANILKSVMKQLDLELSVDIPLETVINCQIGILVGNDYEMLNFGNYVVYSSEKQEDTNTYKIVCYDKILYSMKQNEDLEITYPISIKNYLTAIANKIGLTVASGTFYNQDLQIPDELYLGLEYTYRDILDEIAQATGSIICLNTNDEIVVKYPTITGDTIDEEYLKDVNVDFAEKYGPINSIVLTRAGGSDSVYLQDTESVTQNGLCEIKIQDNQIMNFNNRSDYLQGLLSALDGLFYYKNDFNSTGIMYYDVGDLYNIQIGEKNYQCLMLNDEINVTTGIEEIIHTDLPEQSETDYSKADKTDRRINQTYLIVDKQNQTISSVVSNVEGQNSKISQINQRVDELESSIQEIADITIAEESQIAKVNLSDINESEPIMVKVHPITESITKLYPKSNLYPSNTQYLKTRTINFKRTYTEEGVTKTQNIPYELPDDLLYYDSNNYDEFYLDYDSQTCQITKRCEWFGGSGTNLYNPSYFNGTTQYIENIVVTQDERFVITPSSQYSNVVETTTEINFNNDTLYLYFTNLFNIQNSDITMKVDYYDKYNQYMGKEYFYNGNATISANYSGTKAKYCKIEFTFNNRVANEDYSFNIMLNVGSTALPFETYYPAIQPTGTEQIVTYSPYPEILLGAGDYEVSLLGYDIGYLFVRLMVANIYTKEFATQAQLTSRINQTAEDITLSVDRKLTNYSTTNDMRTEIRATAEDITSTVEQIYATKDTTNSLSSRIKQTAKSIELTTTDNGTSAGITIRMRNEDGTQIDTDAANITLSGKVAFTNLTDGTTTISGSNIKTGTIDASKVTVKNIDADKITTGTLSGSKIEGGTIDGNKVTIKNLDASKITAGTLSASKISGGTLNADNMTVKNLTADSIKSKTLNGISLTSSSISGTSISGGSVSGSSITNGSVTGARYKYQANSECIAINRDQDGAIEGYYTSDGSLTQSTRRYSIKAFNAGGKFQTFNSSGAMAAYFDQNGASKVAPSSDKRLKKNIKGIKEKQSMQIINDLRPVEYMYKKNDDKKHRGLIAQEVEDSLKKVNIKDEVYIIDEKGEYRLDYTELIPDLINCIKYLTKEIEELKGGNK